MSKVNGRVMVLKTVRGDFPFGHHCIAEPGIYDAYVNPQGAVSVRVPNGELLGLKPVEYKWLQSPSIEQ